jgi:hypothetical protein
MVKSSQLVMFQKIVNLEKIPKFDLVYQELSHIRTSLDYLD